MDLKQSAIGNLNKNPEMISLTKVCKRVIIHVIFLCYNSHFVFHSPPFVCLLFPFILFLLLLLYPYLVLDSLYFLL